MGGSMLNIKTAHTDIAALNAEIAEVKKALADVHGTETEVYARIVGYYRSVRNWNKGKRDEYNLRKQFICPERQETARITTNSECTVSAAENIQEENTTQKAATYEFFARKTCPNCPPVKEYLSKAAMRGTLVDVDSDQGLARAAEKGVFAAPTVILYAADGTEVARAHDVQGLNAVMEQYAETIQQNAVAAY